MHIPDKQRSKLDDKSQKYIFISYDANSKGYKLYNPNIRKTIISQDVIFDEEGEWDWGQHNEDYNFLPYFEEDDIKHPRIKQVREEPTTLPTSPAASTQEHERSSERVPHLMSLQELYEVIENQ